jgi:hypothetical protein
MRKPHQRSQAVPDDVVAGITGRAGDEAHATRVVLHGHRLWQRRFDK